MKKVSNILMSVVLVVLVVFLVLLMASRYAQRDSMIYDAVVVTPSTQSADTASETTPDT